MLLGLSGKIGSGKDTFAQLLEEHMEYCKLKSFAYKLKYICAFLTGTELATQFTQIGKNVFLEEWGMTIGEMQQKVGTEGMRDGVHPETWILSLFADYDPKENWIITDVRFVNEAEAIKERGGYVIRINGDPANIRMHSKRDLTHPSETSLDNYRFDYVINNEPPLENLKRQVNCVIKQFSI